MRAAGETGRFFLKMLGKDKRRKTVGGEERRGEEGVTER